MVGLAQKSHPEDEPRSILSAEPFIQSLSGEMTIAKQASFIPSITDCNAASVSASRGCFGNRS